MLELDGITEEDYDKAIKLADKTYCKRMHNICCDNCHSHVAKALNILNYKGKNNYTMVHVWWMLLTGGKYLTWGHLLCTYVGYILIAIIALTSTLIAKYA